MLFSLRARTGPRDLGTLTIAVVILTASLSVRAQSSSSGSLPTPPTPTAQSQGTDALIGVWAGRASYKGDSRALSLRFEIHPQRKVLVVYLSMPELKFQNIGPVPVKERDGEYTALAYRFRLSADGMT